MEKDNQGHLPNKADAPVTPSPVTPPKLGLFSVLSTLISLGWSVWQWIKNKRRQAEVSAGEQKVQSNQGDANDYAGLDDIQNGVYDRGPARSAGDLKLLDPSTDGKVLREQTEEGGESVQRTGKGSGDQRTSDRPSDEEAKD